MKYLKTICILLLSFMFTEKAHAQLKKDWGFWITDTAFNELGAGTNTYDILVDKKDNIYLQFTKDGKVYDTLFVRSYSPKGELRWENKIFNTDPTGIIVAIDADFRYDSDLDEIQSHYLKRDSFGFHLMVKCFNEQGRLIRTLDAVVSSSYDYNCKHSFWDKAGNYFILNEVYEDLKIARINSSGQVLEQSIEKEPEHEISSGNYQIQDLDANTFAVQFLTSKYTFLGSVYYNNLRVLNKSDFSTQFFYSYIANTSYVMPNYCIGMDDGIYLFSTEIVKFDKQCNFLWRKEQVSTNILETINDGFLLANSSTLNFDLHKMDWNGDEIWRTKKQDTLLETCRGIKSNADYIVTNGNLIHQFGSNPFPYPIIRNFAVATKRLNKTTGEIIGEYAEPFDTARGDIYNSKFAVDSKGGSIMLTDFLFMNQRVPLIGKVTRSAFYLHKVSSKIADVIPVVRNDSNYLNILKNPTGNQLQYEFTIGTPEALQFIMYDMYGRTIFCDEHDSYVTGYYKKTIDLSTFGMTPGHYFLSMRTGYSKYTRQFVYAP